MRVIITDFAKNQIRETAKYILREFGKTSKDRFIKNVQLTRNLIGINPYLGILEPLLENEPGNNRSIVVNSFNKLIYHIVDDHIEVSAFWDMRREPDSLIGQIISEQ